MTHESDSPFLVDISPYVVVAGNASGEDENAGSLNVASVDEVLRSGRFLASVDHQPVQEDDYVEVNFRMACDAEGRVLQVSVNGAVEFGKPLDEVESDLAAVLGCVVDLWRDGEPDDDADEEPEHLDEAVDLDRAEDPGPTEVTDVGWIDDQGDRFADRSPGRFRSGSTEYGASYSRLTQEDIENFDEISDVEDDEWTPDPERTLVFSRRGQSDGLGLAWLTGADVVESGVDGDWSVFRLTVEDAEDHGVPWTARTCVPSVTVSRTTDDPDGGVLALVETRKAHEWDALYIGLTDAVHCRPVFQPSELSAEAQHILTLLQNEHLDPASDTVELLQDPHLNVDAIRLQAALAPNFPATIEERTEEFLLALGLPESLVRPAVREEGLPSSRTYTRRHVWKNLKQVVLDGVSGLQPRGRRRGPYRRWEDFMCAHPRVALLASGIQAVLGAGMVATSWPGGGWNTAVLLAGGLLVLDAVADALITRARRRRRR